MEAGFNKGISEVRHSGQAEGLRGLFHEVVKEMPNESLLCKKAFYRVLRHIPRTAEVERAPLFRGVLNDRVDGFEIVDRSPTSNCVEILESKTERINERMTSGAVPAAG